MDLTNTDTCTFHLWTQCTLWLVHVYKI